MCDFLMALGGGDEVGASAYYLSIDGVHILLDCGARLKGEELYPDYEKLLYEMNDYSELDLIFISHAHYDHIGSVARIASLAPNAEIITTEATKRLIYAQLLEFGRISGRRESDGIKNERYRKAQFLMERIRTKPVMQPFVRHGCKFTMMPAGHMSGAVMIYMETQQRNILYTGDFSLTSMSGINEMKLVKAIHPDVLLMNMPNAYQEKEVWDRVISGENIWKPKSSYTGLREVIRKQLQRGNKIYLTSRSIPKHLDLFFFLQAFFPDVPVYLEEKSQKIADILSDLGYQVYGPNIHIAETISGKSHIIVGQEENRAGCVAVLFDQYSLHASVSEALMLIRKLAPEALYLLHTHPTGKKLSPEYALRTLLPNTQVVQVRNGEKNYLKRREKMKYYPIYQTVMEAERKIAENQLREEQKGKVKTTGEWLAIYGSLSYPGLHPHDAYDKLQRISGRHSCISYEEYCRCLHSVNLDSEERRRYVLSIVEEGIGLLKKALDGKKEAVLQFADFTGNLDQRDRKNGKYYFIGKYMVIFMILQDPDLKNSSYRPIAYTFGARYCNRVLRTIRDQLIKENGLNRKRKSAKDVLVATESVLSESVKAEKMATGDAYEQLLFKYHNCKNSLELVQAMLDELNETVDETAAEAKNTAIASFYVKMNSETYGHLLDSMEFVERRITDLKKDQIKIPPQLLPLTIVFKQLMKFIRESGITPIDRTGREFEAEVEMLEQYTYIGEPFHCSDEKKKVVVEKPGWKYENIMISLPTVREKEE